VADGSDVRLIAMSLPRTSEHLIRDYTKYRIGRIVYASVSPDETLLGFGFPKEERAGLVASEPDKFMMPVPSDERYQWVRARLAAVDVDELRELLIDAWRMCVPKKVAAAYLENLLPRLTLAPGRGAEVVEVAEAEAVRPGSAPRPFRSVRGMPCAGRGSAGPPPAAPVRRRR
jgi:hypothetical protein